MHHILLLVINEKDISDDIDQTVANRMDCYYENYSGALKYPESDDLWYDWITTGYPENFVEKDGRKAGYCRLSELDFEHTDFSRFSTYADDNFATDWGMLGVDWSPREEAAAVMNPVILDHLHQQEGNPLLVCVNYHN